jgi:hypothetical protein
MVFPDHRRYAEGTSTLAKQSTVLQRAAVSLGKQSTVLQRAAVSLGKQSTVLQRAAVSVTGKTVYRIAACRCKCHWENSLPYCSVPL